MTTTLGDFEVHTVPSGASAFYRDSDHSYYGEVREKKPGEFSGVRDARLTSVTGVTGMMDGGNNDGLLKWAAGLDRLGVSALAAEGLSLEDADEIRSALDWLTTPESVGAALEDARLDWRSVREDAATRGTNVHELALHALASNHPVPAFDSMTDEERGYAQGVVKWWATKRPTVVASEFLVVDLQMRVAGRPDLLCEIDGVLTIVDAKTGSYLSEKWASQLAGYALLCAASGYPVPGRGIILQVDAQGGYTPTEIDIEPEDFLAALACYRQSASIKRRFTAARREREAVAA